MGNMHVLLAKKEVPDIKYTEHMHTLGEHVCRKANLGTKYGYSPEVEIIFLDNEDEYNWER